MKLLELYIEIKEEIPYGAYSSNNSAVYQRFMSRYRKILTLGGVKR